MSIRRFLVDYHRLPIADLTRWATIPLSVVAAALGGGHRIASTIRPMAANAPRLCGQARTVVVRSGDRAALLEAVSLVETGEVLMAVDDRNDDRTGRRDALAGEWVTRCCKRRALGGLVVDGAVADLCEVGQLGLPVYGRRDPGRSVTAAPALAASGQPLPSPFPCTPSGLAGSLMDTVAAVGGVRVRPGDLILGDSAGLIVVPLAHAEAALSRCLTISDTARPSLDSTDEPTIAPRLGLSCSPRPPFTAPACESMLS